MKEVRALETLIGEQRLSEEDARIRDEAYARLLIWKTGCQEIHDRARVARKILLLDDPYQDPPGVPPEQRTMQLQTLKSTFNNCVADQVDNRPEALMTPETPELQGMVDDINDIVRYIYEANNYWYLHRFRVEDFIGTGTSIIQIMWDENMAHGRGDVALIRVPVEQFLWDPAEADIQNARALFKVSWHPLSWFRAQYPENGVYVAAEDNDSRAVGQEENQETMLSDEHKAMLLEYWYRTYDAAKRRYTINCMYLAGGAVLEHHKNVYAHGMYPFVVNAFTEIRGLPVGEGLVMELAPMMRYINRYAHYMDVNIRQSSHIRMLVRNNSNIDKRDVADWTKDVITGDSIGEDSVRFLQSAPLTSLAMQQMYQLQTDLKQDSGQNQFTRGETAGGVTAATAIASLQEAGGKQTRMRTHALNQGFQRITEQILWLVSEYYGENRVQMITGKDGEFREVDASASRLMGHRRGGAVPPPPYTVRIQVQRLNPQAIQSQNELIMNAYTMAAQAGQPFPLSVLFGLLTVDGKDRILPVLTQLDAQMQQMQQIAAENEQLQATVQQQQESIDGMKKLISQQSAAAQMTSAAGAAPAM